MTKCACKGSFLEKFIQPAILVSLMDGDKYGFAIYKALMEENLIGHDELDPAGFYRMLKKMEKAGLIASSTEGQPQQRKKTLSITPEGKACLLNWERTLKDYQEHVENLWRIVHQCNALYGNESYEL